MSAMAPTGGSDIFLIQHECFVLISGNSEGLVVRGTGRPLKCRMSTS